MKGFTSFLAEAKNTHMEHIEDNILNAGVDGARQSLNSVSYTHLTLPTKRIV